MVNRRSNLLTSRFGYFGTWNSRWVGENTTYSDLVHQDFKIVSFLNGLFRKLEIPTSKFNITRYSLRLVTIENDLYVIHPFLVMYSHIDRVFENASVYYLGRIFFSMPLLLMRSIRSLKKKCNASYNKKIVLENTFRNGQPYAVNSAILQKNRNRNSSIDFESRVMKYNVKLVKKKNKKQLVKFLLSKFNIKLVSRRRRTKKRKFRMCSALAGKYLRGSCTGFFIRVLRLILLGAKRSVRINNKLRKLRKVALLVHFFLFRKTKCAVAKLRRKTYTNFAMRALARRTSSRYAPYYIARVVFAIRLIKKFCFFLRRFSRRSTIQYKLKRSFSRLLTLVGIVSSIRCIACSHFIYSSLLYAGMFAYASGMVNFYFVSNVSMHVGSFLEHKKKVDRKLRLMLRFGLRVRLCYRYMSYYYLLVGMFASLIAFGRYAFCSTLNRIFKFGMASCLSALSFSVTISSRIFGSIYNIILGKLLTIQIQDVKSKLMFRRLGFSTYYKNLSVINKTRYLLWIFGRVRIGTRLFFKRKINMRIGNCLSKRNSIKLSALSKVHSAYYNKSAILYNRKQFLKRFKFLYKFLHSMVSIRWLRLSIDKLIQNIELTLSEYLQASVFFFPRIYMERLRSKYWLHNILKDTIRRPLKRLNRNRRSSGVRFVRRSVPYVERKVHNVKKIVPSFKKRSRSIKSIVNRRVRRYTLLRSLLNYTLLRCKSLRTKKSICKQLQYIKFVRRAWKGKFSTNNKPRVLKQLRRRRRVKFRLLSRRLANLKSLRRSRVTRKPFLKFKAKIKPLSKSKIQVRPLLKSKVQVKPLLKSKVQVKSSQKLKAHFSPLQYLQYKKRLSRGRRARYFRNLYLRFKRRVIRGRIGKRNKRFRIKHRGPLMRSRFPPIKDAKLICDYIVYHLNKRVRLFRLFSNLRYWQKLEYRVTNTLQYVAWVESGMVTKKYPLSGIRILCAGSPKKGGRKRRNHYHLWVRNQRLTRTMPLQEIEMDIDYFSSNTHVTTGTVGVKVWVCFSTISYKYRTTQRGYYI